jgi:thioredoxin reductase (NADPH)
VAKSVAIIHRRDEYRASPAKIEILKNAKTKKYLDYQIVSANNNVLTIKNNKDDKTLEVGFDVLLVQYGQKIINKRDVFKDVLKDNNKKIIVDKKMQTNIKNIFACGDCCTYTGKVNKIINGQLEANAVINNVAKAKKL